MVTSEDGKVSTYYMHLDSFADINQGDYVKEGTIQSITSNYQIDLTFLVLFFILLLVSYIFRYGEELQQQVDETL